MAAEKKNKYWKLRETHGRKLIFKTPDDLWGLCCDYFEWVESNPLKEEKIFVCDKSLKRRSVKKMRAMSIEALCIYLGIVRRTWDGYRERPGFVDTVELIESIIFDQQFTGASAGLLNSSIIARKLGLADKSELSTDPNNPITPVINVTVSDKS